MYKQAIRFLRPPQSQRLNYLKANWVLKWAICQWEAHWFNLPCGFAPDATGAPLCALKKRDNRYTYRSLNSSSKRVVMGRFWEKGGFAVLSHKMWIFILGTYVFMYFHYAPHSSAEHERKGKTERRKEKLRRINTWALIWQGGCQAANGGDTFVLL